MIDNVERNGRRVELMATKTKGERYVKRIHKTEKEKNLHMREMIAMIKHEEVKDNLYVKGVKLTKHAMHRVEEHFGISSLATATKKIKEMLSKAQRIGSVVSYEGRINVMYAYDKTAILLSPDLKNVVTVNKCPEVTYQPFLEKVKDDKELTKQKLLDMHWKLLKEIEEQELKQEEKLLMVEKNVSEAVDQYRLILDVGRKGKGRKKKVKEMISHHNLLLKVEGIKLFSIKRKKKHVCRSLASLY